MSGLPHHFECPTPYPLVPAEDPLAPDRHGTFCSGRRLDPSAAERVFGYRQTTSITWLSRAGQHAQSFHEHFFCHLQLDELRTRLRSNTHVLWLWLAIDPCTKILPVLHLGPRTQNAAHAVIHSLRRILAPGCLPLFTSNGLNVYFYALTAHFGHWLQVGRRGRKVLRWQVAAELIYGQVKKSYQCRKLARVTPVMRLGTSAALTAALKDWVTPDDSTPLLLNG